jgi:hypothetical protein
VNHAGRRRERASKRRRGREAWGGSCNDLVPQLHWGRSSSQCTCRNTAQVECRVMTSGECSLRLQCNSTRNDSGIRIERTKYTLWPRLMLRNPCLRRGGPEHLLELNSLQSRGAIGPGGKTGGKPTGPSGTRRVPSGLRPCAAIWMQSHSMAYKWRKWSSSLQCG